MTNSGLRPVTARKKNNTWIYSVQEATKEAHGTNCIVYVTARPNLMLTLCVLMNTHRMLRTLMLLSLILTALPHKMLLEVI